MASAVFGSGKKLHSGYQSEVASHSSLQEAKPPPSWNALLRLMSELFFDVSGSAQCPPPLASTSGQSQKVVLGQLVSSRKPVRSFLSRVLWQGEPVKTSTVSQNANNDKAATVDSKQESLQRRILNT